MLLGMSILLIFFKAGHFTMDNASVNYTMMQELEIMFNERDIDFDAADRQIMCYRHIVNLSSGRVIEGATKAAATATTDCDEDCSGPPPPDLPGQQSYDDALARDPIALSRNVVRAIRASGTQRNAFDEVITDGNKNKWFLVGQPLTVTKIVPKQLLRDVCTRWDSVYQMLNRLREMRPVRFFPAVINSLLLLTN
jgi:hypothetical protein